jgi:hypothetical protein
MNIISDRIHVVKPILKIQSAFLYKEGEIHCNSQCHVICTRSHLPGPVSFNVLHENDRIMLKVSIINAAILVQHIKRLRDQVSVI